MDEFISKLKNNGTLLISTLFELLKVVDKTVPFRVSWTNIASGAIDNMDYFFETYDSTDGSKLFKITKTLGSGSVNVAVDALTFTALESVVLTTGLFATVLNPEKGVKFLLDGTEWAFNTSNKHGDFLGDVTNLFIDKSKYIGEMLKIIGTDNYDLIDESLYKIKNDVIESKIIETNIETGETVKFGMQVENIDGNYQIKIQKDASQTIDDDVFKLEIAKTILALQAEGVSIGGDNLLGDTLVGGKYKVIIENVYGDERFIDNEYGFYDADSFFLNSGINKMDWDNHVINEYICITNENEISFGEELFNAKEYAEVLADISTDFIDTIQLKDVSIFKSFAENLNLTWESFLAKNDFVNLREITSLNGDTFYVQSNMDEFDVTLDSMIDAELKVRGINFEELELKINADSMDFASRLEGLGLDKLDVNALAVTNMFGDAGSYRLFDYNAFDMAKDIFGNTVVLPSDDCILINVGDTIKYTAINVESLSFYSDSGLSKSLGVKTVDLFNIIDKRPESLDKFVKSTIKQQASLGERFTSQLLAKVVEGILAGKDIEDIAEELAIEFTATEALTKLAENIEFFPSVFGENGTLGQNAVKGAIINFAVTALMNADEFDSDDYVKAAASVSVQAIVSYGVEKYLAEKLVVNVAGEKTAEGFLTKSEAGGITAAIISLASDALFGDGIDEHSIVDAAVAGTTAYISTAVAISMAKTMALAGSWVGPIGAIVGAVLGYAISCIFQPKQLDDGEYWKPEPAFVIEPKADGTGNQIIGVSKEGALLRASELGYEDDIYGTNYSDVLVGNDAENVIVGGSGNDMLEGMGGGDVLVGGAGSDSIYGGDGDDMIDGLSENDKIFAGAGADSVIGGTGDDIIYGEAGDDNIDGSEGRDYIDAGLGNDIVVSGSGDDSVLGNEGNDYVSGGAGNDDIKGNEGKDTLTGGEGNDSMYGGEDADIVYGENGTDIIYGQAGIDILYGGTGNDIIDGGADADLLYGGLGADILYGNSGNDALYGELGNDYLIGGLGADTLDGAEGDDVLTGDAGDDILDGGTGDDVYVFAKGDGADTITDEDGNDTIKFIDTASTEIVFTKSGDDLVISFTDGSDKITISNQFLNAGINKLEFFNEKEINLSTLIFDDQGIASYSVVDSDNFAEIDVSELILEFKQSIKTQDDEVLYNQYSTWYDSNYDLNIVKEFADYEFYNNVQWIPYTKKRNIFGGHYTVYRKYYQKNLQGYETADKIVGAWWTENIFGKDGEDFLYGNDGNDTINGCDSHDIAFGGAGNDSVSGGIGDDKLYGGEDNDNMSGNEGNDILYGEWGDDVLSGNAGDDVLDGGFDNDKLSGDEGNDVLLGASGKDTIDGGSGRDLISGGVDHDNLIGGAGNDTVYGGDGQDKIYGDAGDDELYGDDHNDVIEGGEGNDTIYGGNYGDDLYGNEGNDFVSGDSGDDNIYGGAGSDTLSGGSGNDYIEDGRGADVLTGGTGTDFFILTRETNTTDIITDFNPDTEKLVLKSKYNDPITFSLIQNSMVQEGNDVKITLDDGYILLLKNVDKSMINNSNFVIGITGNQEDNLLHGTDGMDYLFGGAGDDTLLGGAGDDFLDGGSGADNLYGQAGDDVLYYSVDGVWEDDYWNNQDIRYYFTEKFGYIGNVGHIHQILSSDVDYTNVLNNLGYLVEQNILAVDIYLEGGPCGRQIGFIEWMLKGYISDHIYFSKNVETGKQLSISGFNRSTDYMDGGVGADALIMTNGIDSISLGGALKQQDVDVLYFRGDQCTTHGGAAGVVFRMDGQSYKSYYDNIFSETIKDIEIIYAQGGDDIINLTAENKSYGDIVIYGGEGNDHLWSNIGNDKVYGQEGNDDIYGGKGNDSLSGGLNNDTIYGAEGNDYIEGNQGNDSLMGDAGNDILKPDSGSDRLEGGSGSDVFIIEVNAGTQDTIIDYDKSDTNEKINLTAFADINLSNAVFEFSDLSITVSGNDSKIDLGNNQKLIVKNVTGLSASDFIFEKVVTIPGIAEVVEYTEDKQYAFTNFAINSGSNTITAELSLTNTDAGILDAGAYNSSNGILKLSGTVSEVNNILKDLCFKPKENSAEDFSINIKVIDDQNKVMTDSISVKGIGVNDVPVVTLASVEVDEDGSVDIDVLAGASDVDGDELSVISEQLSVINGEVELIDEKILYTPDTDFNGEDRIIYTVSDGNGGEVTKELVVTVKAINDVPEAVLVSADTDEDNVVEIDVLSYARDRDGDQLSVISDQLLVIKGKVELINGKILYTPNTNFNGEDIITYTISDGNGGEVTKELVVTVKAVNDAPVIEAEIADQNIEKDNYFSLDISNSFKDIEGDVLNYSVSLEDGKTLPAWLKFDVETLRFSGTPSIEDSDLSLNIKITADDNNGGTVEDIFTINIDDGISGNVYIGEDDSVVGDTIFGSGFDDYVNGYGGDDRLYGLDGADTLKGGDGDDLLDGGSGKDDLTGGLGEDTFVISDLGDSTEAGADSIIDFTQGQDKIDLRGLGFTGIKQGAGAGSILGYEFSGGNTIIRDVKTDFALKIIGEHNLAVDDLILFDNKREGTLADNTIYGEEGIDYILGKEGSDILYGESGDDILNGGLGKDDLSGGLGEDRFVISNLGDSTESDADVILDFAQGADKIDLRGLGFTGIQQGAGAGSILGYEFSGGNTIIRDVKTDFAVKVIGEHNLTGDDLILYDSYIEGTVGNDTIYGENSSDIIYGFTGNDTIFGDRSNDIIDGGLGKDDLTGGLGEDTFVISDLGDSTEAGADAIIDFMQGEDKIDLRSLGFTGIKQGVGSGSILGYEFSGGNTIIRDVKTDFALKIIGEHNLTEEDLILFDSKIEGTSGDDIKYGGYGIDYMLGNEGYDRLYGERGNDIINGGLGKDDLTGGLGEDTFVISNLGESTEENADAIIDFMQGEDKIDLRGLGFTNIQQGAGSGSILGYELSGGNTIIRDVNTDFAVKIIGEHNLTGDDLILYDSYIEGTVGNDTIYGENSSDIIYGFLGDDIIFGGRGNDIIDGGFGKDDLTGGLGEDRFVISDLGDSTEAGADSVIDFINGEDKIDLRGLGFTGIKQGVGAGSILGYEFSGGNTIIRDVKTDFAVKVIGEHNLTGDDLILYDNYIQGTSGDDIDYGGYGIDYMLGKEGYDRLYGERGNDIIDGDLGKDDLTGGLGQDTFVISNIGDSTEAGADSIIDFMQGEDKIDLRGLGFTNIQQGAGSGSILGYELSGGNTIIRDVNTDFAVKIIGEHNLTGNDFLLYDKYIQGMSGNDTISGQDSSDIITAGAGDDIISGGLGADYLYGESGSDTFDYSSLQDSKYNEINDEMDIIMDFIQGEDKIDLSGLGFTDIQSGEGSGDVIGYSFAGGNTIIDDIDSDFAIKLVGEHDLVQSDFIFN